MLTSPFAPNGGPIATCSSAALSSSRLVDFTRHSIELQLERTRNSRTGRKEGNYLVQPRRPSCALAGPDLLDMPSTGEGFGVALRGTGPSYRRGKSDGR